LWGLLAGAGLMIVVLPWLFFSGPSTPPVPAPPGPRITIEKKPAPIAPAPSAPETPLSAAVLRDQLAGPLNQLREAQLKKDISQYSQVFAPDFPDFDKRRQKTLAVWEAYDYSGLDYELVEVKLLDANHAQAAVTWKLNIQQKATQAAKSETQSYIVWFAKDAGKWRISKLEMVRRPG